MSYPFREAVILAYGPTMSTGKKSEKWKSGSKRNRGEKEESGVQNVSHPLAIGAREPAFSHVRGNGLGVEGHLVR